MHRRTFLRHTASLGASLVGAPLLNLGRHLLAATGPSVSTRAIDIVSRATVVDMLGLLTMDWPKLRQWHRDPTSFAEDDFRRLERTGVRIFHPAIELETSDPDLAARRQLAGWNLLVDSQPCFLFRVESFEQMLEETARGKLGIVLGLQNSKHFRSAADVERFYELGQRVSQLTYNSRNRLGSGCCVATDRGLTELGAAVVAEMNRLGMVVDVSHCGERTSSDAILASQRPVLVTHANCRALAPGQPRNKSDDVIRLLAARGGVFGITLVRGFVGSGSPGLDRVLDHFDHITRLVGVEHVGLGTDVAADTLDTTPAASRAIYAIRGLELPLRVFQIAEGLLGRGYSERDVELVLGGNFLRALGEIWTHGAWAPSSSPQELRSDPFCPARRPPAASLAADGAAPQPEPAARPE